MCLCLLCSILHVYCLCLVNWLHARVDIIQNDLQAAEYHFNEVRISVLVSLVIINSNKTYYFFIIIDTFSKFYITSEVLRSCFTSIKAQAQY